MLDIKEAYFYYKEQKAGLGNRFLETIESYLERVQKYPEHYQIKRKPYREAFIKKFPYIIIYEIEGDKVIIQFSILGEIQLENQLNMIRKQCFV